MSFNNNSSTDLSRYSIGEIADLSGVADFYNAGSSRWLRSATFTASSNLSATTKTNLVAAQTSDTLLVAVQGPYAAQYKNQGACSFTPVARISASGVSVYSSYYKGTTAVGVGVGTSAGYQFVATGQTAVNAASDTNGLHNIVVSNNTTIFSYCFSSGTVLSAASTTNGTTWTAGTLSGLPTFSTATRYTCAWASSISTSSYTCNTQYGYKRARDATNGQFAVMWCGARFLIIAPGTGGTNYVASLSTDGLAWGGDNSTAVLGSGTIGFGEDIQFWNYGNYCYLNVGTFYRYSTDGGVTWAASTFAAAPNPSTYFIKTNKTDPAKLIITNGDSTVAYYSADYGATWSANRALPFSAYHGLAYNGSTVVIATQTNGPYVSTNNGTTWVASSLPLAQLGNGTTQYRVFSDANRFYMGIFSQYQILTSADGVTWTLVTLSAQFYLQTTAAMGPGIVSFDSNTVVLIGYHGGTATNGAVWTNDGGVTWGLGQYTKGNDGGTYYYGGDVFTTPDNGGMAQYMGGGGFTNTGTEMVFKSDITANGSFYRTGKTAIGPLRTSAISYVRVG